MKRVTRNYILFLPVIGCVLLSIADAQTYLRDARGHGYPYMIKVAGEFQKYGDHFVPPNFGTSLCEFVWNYKPPGGTVEQVNINLPFHRLGALEDYDGEAFAAAGLKYISWNPVVTKGVICRGRFITSSPRQIVIDETREYDGIDPSGISWNSERARLYILDHRSMTIMSALWGGPLSTTHASLPSAFSTCVTRNELAILSKPATITLGAVNRAAHESQDPLVDPGLHIRTEASLGYWHLYFHNSQGWQVVEYPKPTDGVSEFVVAGNVGVGLQDGCFSNGFSLSTAGSDGANFRIEDVDGGQVVFSGVIGSPGQEVVVSNIPEFVSEPGRPYRVVDDNDIVLGLGIRSCLRYGDPQVNTLLSVSRLSFPFAGAWTDSPLFGVWGFLSSTTSAQETVPCQLWISLRNADGTDPVVQLGPQHFALVADIVVDFSLALPNPPADVGHHLPINAPTLAGAVVLMQYVFATTAGIVWSDVIGTTVWDLESGQQMRGSGGSLWTEKRRKSGIEYLKTKLSGKSFSGVFAQAKRLILQAKK